jgi:CubicO group peptidase (beta-lactamase class C family)
LEKYLPLFPIKGPADGLRITLRHLLTHTSGLPRESPFPYWSDFHFPSREEFIQALSKQHPLFAPEEKWKYSNLGIALAGEVVAAVSGETFETYVQNHILAPLGMKSSAVGMPEALRPKLAKGYGRRMPDGQRDVRPFSDTRALNPAGGLSSTVEDLARFVALQFRSVPVGGSMIVSATTLNEMQRVHWLRSDWSGGQGMGFTILHRADGDVVASGGWIAGYQTGIYFRPKEKFAVIALINADDGEPYTIADRALKWVAPAVNKVMNPPAVPVARREWQKYVGKYRSPWGDSQVLVMNGKLVLIGPTDDDPLSGMVTLSPTGPHQFRIEDGPPTAAHGEPVLFELKDGKVARVKIVETYFYPIP